MKIDREGSFVDTNVLVYSVFEQSPQHRDSRALLLDSAQTLVVSPQILTEFYSVITHSRQTSHPRTPAQARQAIEAILNLPAMSLIAIPGDSVERWLTLIDERSVRGPASFDLQIVATMLSHGLRAIYTFNRKDFEPFSELDVRRPGEHV